ncbi:MAG: bestrophin family protein [Bryobacteraceae bacterium]
MMIVRRKLPLSRILHFVANRIVLFFAIDVAIAVGYVLYGQKWLAIPNLPLSLAGAALTIFLGFRIKAAYDRWWEARILWGALVNWSRTLARRCQIFPSFATSAEEREQVEEFQGKMTYWQIAFVNALRCHLRKHDSLDELGQWLTPEAIEELRRYENVPMGIQLKMGHLLRNAFQQGWLDDYRFVSIEEALAEMTNVQGACERIKNTPFPRQFDYFPRLFTNVFCFMMPLGLVADLGILTPLASSLIAFMLLSLESFGSHLEDPFENTINDVPMSALSRSIEINLKQGLGERQVPEPLKPVEGFLF